MALTIACFGFSKQSRSTKASSAGPLPSHTGAPGEQTCIACHSSFTLNSGVGNLKIEGLPKVYFPNQEIPVIVTLTDQNAKLYGFQTTAIDSTGRAAGSFILPPQTPLPVQIIAGTIGNFPRAYIEHTAEGIVPTQPGARTWSFVWRAPSQRVGRVRLYAAGNAADGGGDTRFDYIYTKNAAMQSGAANGDFDGDGKSDIAVFRPSNGFWYFTNSGGQSGNFQAVQFGADGDIPQAGDFDGDAKTDFAVFRPDGGTWYVLESANRNFRAVRFGQNGDVPMSGDFSGDGRTDFAVFRPSEGVWYILDGANNQFSARQFGQNGDVPLAGDFDADAKTDLAVYRGGLWFILRSGDNSLASVRFGLPDDAPQAADFDGDGKTDIAVFRRSGGVWYFLNSESGFSAVQFGINTDVPAAADYDGDGRGDIAVYRGGAWFIRQSSSGEIRYETFGLGTDLPVVSRPHQVIPAQIH